MKQAIKQIVIFVATLALVISALFLAARADDVHGMKRLGYGLPFSYVYEDLSDYNDSFAFFPRYQKFEFTKSKVAEISFLKFSFDFIIVFVALEMLIYIMETIYFKLRRNGEEE